MSRHQLSPEQLSIVNQTGAVPNEAWCSLEVARWLGVRDDEGEVVQTEHGPWREVKRGESTLWVAAESKP